MLFVLLGAVKKYLFYVKLTNDQKQCEQNNALKILKSNFKKRINCYKMLGKFQEDIIDFLGMQYQGHPDTKSIRKGQRSKNNIVDIIS